MFMELVLVASLQNDHAAYLLHAEQTQHRTPLNSTLLAYEFTVIVGLKKTEKKFSQKPFSI